MASAIIGSHGRKAGLAVVLALLVLLAQPAASAHAASTCQSSGPGSQAYTVTVCITQPTNGSVASGALPVTATISVSGSNPGLRWPVFYLDGSYFTMTWVTPSQITLPTAHYLDGPHTLSYEAQMSDGFNSARATVNLVFANGVTSPPVNTNKFSPAFSSPQPGQPFVVAAAGDGAVGDDHSDQVSAMAKSWNPNLFMYLGDVYLNGSVGDFYNWYGQPNTFFGRLKAVSNPTIGNHEYQTGTPAPYVDYWNNVPHYYSYNAAGWHFISLDNTSEFNQYSTTSAQYQWLVQDLNANTSPCTMVYFHRPIYGASWTGGAPELASWWNLFAQHGVKIALAGHEHDYQRWKPLDGSGNPSPTGVTEFVAGTGGMGIDPISRADSRLAVGLGNADDYGAFRLEISGQGATYKFAQVGGNVLDQGTIPCATSSDTTPPTTPTAVTASAISPTQVNLSWSASTDNVGVVGYTVYRNGAQVATVGGSTLTYSDTAASPGTTYSYTVDAFDAAANHSSPSSPATATTGGIGFIQAGSAATGNRVTSTTINFTNAVRQGDLLAGWFAEYDSSGQVSVSDNVNGAWTRSVSTHFSTGSGDIALYYLPNSKASSSGLTVNVSASAPTWLEGSAGEYAGVAITNPLDQAVLATGSSAVADSGGAPSVGAGDLVFGGLTANSNPGSVGAGSSQGAPFQLRNQLSGNAAEDILSGPSGVNHATFTLGSSVRWYAVCALFKPASADTQPPSVPSALTATAASATRVNLSWSASTDNVGVTGYTIYRGGTQLATVGGSSLAYSDSTVTPSTSYSYTVDAVDAAGNHSAQSAAAAVTTPAAADTQAPSVPNGIAATAASATRVNLSWSASSDNVGVTGYTIYRGGTQLATVGGSTLTYSDTTVTPSTSYSYTIDAYDAAGNHSAQSAAAAVTTPAADAQAPTVPSGLTATAASATRVNLSWSASSDNVGVTGYTIYRGGTQLATVGGSTLTYSDTTVTPSTSYSYTVDAYDAAGNHSAQSAAAAVTTPAASVGHVAFIQSGATSTGSKVASTTILMSKPVGAGDLLVGWFAQYDSTGQVSVSDNLNGAWTRAAGETFNSGTGDIALYYLANSKASAAGLTITISAPSTTYLQGSTAEYSGVASVNPQDQLVVARGTGTTAGAGPTGLVAAGELVFGAINTGGSPSSLTPGSSQGQPFSLRAKTSSGSAGAEDVVSSAAGTQSSSFTLGAATDWYMVVATFRSS